MCDKLLTNMRSDMDPSTAKKLAEGDIDPVTLSPMEDINPSFVPRGKGSAPVSNDRYRVDKGKSKVADTPNRGGILSFFGVSSGIEWFTSSHITCQVPTRSYRLEKEDPPLQMM